MFEEAWEDRHATCNYSEGDFREPVLRQECLPLAWERLQNVDVEEIETVYARPQSYVVRQQLALRWIPILHPDHLDTICEPDDTCHTGEKTNGEYGEDPPFLIPGHLEAVDYGKGEGQDGRVREDINHSRRDPGAAFAGTLRGIRGVLDLFFRGTLTSVLGMVSCVCVSHFSLQVVSLLEHMKRELTRKLLSITTVK